MTLRGRFLVLYGVEGAWQIMTLRGRFLVLYGVEGHDK